MGHLRTPPEELLVQKGKNGVFGHTCMKKLKNVWNVILKVLTNVRTHTEKLLVPKIEFSPFSTFSHKNRKGL